MKTIIIIQARMGSTRLPGKVLMPINDRVVLDYVVHRCKKIDHISEIIVATSTLSTDDPIAEWCTAHQVHCYRGSEDDVLSRYYECAVLYNPEYVIRVTSDCPFLDYDLANQTIELMKNDPADIVVNRQQDQLTRGLAIELISFQALKTIYEISSEPKYREHVTLYAYEHSEQFQAIELTLFENILQPNLRLTIDTPEDYEVCRILGETLEDSINRPSKDFVNYLLEHENVRMINAHIQQKIIL